jgi:hypothetical protein
LYREIELMICMRLTEDRFIAEPMMDGNETSVPAPGIPSIKEMRIETMSSIWINLAMLVTPIHFPLGDKTWLRPDNNPKCSPLEAATLAQVRVVVRAVAADLEDNI